MNPWSRRLRLGITGAFVGFMGFLAVPVVHIDTPLSTVMVDANGVLLGAQIADDEQWRFPPSGTEKTKFSRALVVAEDKRFYQHPGVDPIAVARAVRLNVLQRRVVTGASTLTMQVVRISRGNPGRTVPEKLVEAVLALRLDFALSKAEILACYADNAPFGGNTVGVEAAAYRYFGRSASDLSWAEAATLAVLPNSPGLIHPGRNRDRLGEKRDRLLDKIYAQGLMSAQDLDLAKLESLPESPRRVPRLAPHLLTRAIVGQGEGLRFETTLDASLQSRTTDVVWRHHRRLSANQVHNLAVMVVHVPTGEVRAYVGNVPEFERAEHHNHVDVITSRRSTGSLLKPFLYGAMLEQGELLPDQLVPDVPIRIGGFAPENFDRTFMGALPASEALARSRNVPATWMLKNYGVGRFHDRLQRLGMRTLDRTADNYGLTLVLGGCEGSVWDLTTLYRNLAWSAMNPDATQGPNAVHWQGDGQTDSPLDTLDPGAAFLTLTALEEVNRPGVHASWRTYGSGRRVAWKTGTSFGFRDGWAIGTTPQYAIGVWVGNADGEGRPDLTGFQAAAPVLFDLFDLVESGAWFEDPTEALAWVELCQRSGMIAGPDCEHRVEAQVPLAGERSQVCGYCERIHCDQSCTHRVHAGCARSDQMQARSWFVLPTSQAWFYDRNHADYHPLPPWDPSCEGQEDTGELALLRPRNGAEVYVPVELNGQRGRVVFEAAHRDDRAQVHWHLDGEFVETTELIHQIALAPAAGAHELTVVDQEGVTARRRFTVLDKKASLVRTVADRLSD